MDYKKLSAEQLTTLRSNGIIGRKKYDKLINACYSRPTRNFKTTMPFKREEYQHLGINKALSVSGLTTKKHKEGRFLKYSVGWK